MNQVLIAKAMNQAKKEMIVHEDFSPQVEWAFGIMVDNLADEEGKYQHGLGNKFDRKRFLYWCNEGVKVKK